ncbi:uncharacterized protein LOC107841320 [Capsicum annuum]|uniref:uncharacterized protein LOC107841320 n=1 Tax=Capsicum annuum TaxID=4072 RepID=UPI001FB0A1CF|nr:uncharacterized protein LOC107841320 [Capsicum annuum]
MENKGDNVDSLMQERGFDSEPVSNLVVGLAFYQLWYSTIPKELRLQEVDRFDSAEQSETFEDRIVMSVLNSDRHDAVEGQEANSPFHSDSDTSVRNDKEILGVDHSSENSPDEWEQQLVNGNSSDKLPYFSLPLWLLPLQLPSSNENLEDDLNMHRTLRNDHYRNAIKYLRHALYSSPPVLEAFHPLIQVLLLGDQVKEALDEMIMMTSFELLRQSSVGCWLKSIILEHFDSGNYVKLSEILEENLEKDPTWEYSTEKLVEMIALHLDADHAKYDTWKELACCFPRLSQCEEDCMSLCSNGEDSEKWWLTRNFSQNILIADIASGDWELLTYKAAMACYLYGREFLYVVKVIGKGLSSWCKNILLAVIV